MEPIIHVLIPMLTLLSFMPNIDKKLILVLMPLTVLPDFDLLFGKHRYFFHNIFFVIFVTAVIYLISNRKNILGFKNLLPSLIALFFLTSHLILDFGGPGVAILYPVYRKLIKIDLLVTTDHNIILNVIGNPLTEATKIQNMPVVTTNGLLLFLIFAPLFILWIFKKDKKLDEIS